MSKNKNLEALKKSSSNLNKILLIFMIIFTSIFWAFAFYAPIEYSRGEYQINNDNSNYLNITKIELNYNAEKASVNIKFEDDMHYILNSNWKQITSPSFPYEPIDIHFQETILDNNTLEINVTSTGEGFFDSDWNLFYDFEIIIDNSYLVDLNSQVTHSQVNIEATDTEFSIFNLNSETGSIHVDFHNVYIHSSVNISEKSGYTDFNIYNSNITSNINFEGDSGSVYFYFYNSAFANINIQTESGSTYLRGNSNIFKNVSIETASSHIGMDVDNSNIHNIRLISSSGSIHCEINEILLLGNVSIYSTSGSLDCDFSEISFYSDRVFDLWDNSGYIDFYWDQEILMNSSAYIFIETISSTIDVEIYTILENIESERFIVQASSETGFFDVEIYER
ncbi:hypothetical protein DSAG12_00915 [Promethearchaeum syntrophicum]|uniref:DUF4097 domain-containing protein n=1 Tax=Promethearchaeum syntrophicum TaxID=2594042 RepID=A0A5B9D7M2_9ARCH|nr:hypothetical protein [Candidatus Prometheoarchaeum syntrophicum]QEE15092.1 hypothetical protein DSAG12_00915 [Candidatus Prometheoarchaeum syntrophicum]